LLGNSFADRVADLDVDFFGGGLAPDDKANVDARLSVFACFDGGNRNDFSRIVESFYCIADFDGRVFFTERVARNQAILLFGRIVRRSTFKGNLNVRNLAVFVFAALSLKL
jgi:hypothetical protein